MFYINLGEKIRTHILCPITFFFENLAVYEIMSKRGGAREAADNNIWRMPFVC
jgi:hypothetical protein